MTKARRGQTERGKNVGAPMRDLIMNFSIVFTSQNIFGAISSEKLPIMILVSKSCIRIGTKLKVSDRKKGGKKATSVIQFLL